MSKLQPKDLLKTFENLTDCREEEKCIVCGRKRAKGFNGFATTYSCMNEDCIKYDTKDNRPPKIIQKKYPDYPKN